MAKMGRPRIQIDQNNFENLCSLHCTLDDIAGWFKCSPDTIERWCKKTYNMTFADTYKRYSARGNASLRRDQFRLAEKNATMAIWLGKQYLGQKDQPEESMDIEDSDAYFESAEIDENKDD